MKKYQLIKTAIKMFTSQFYFDPFLSVTFDYFIIYLSSPFYTWPISNDFKIILQTVMVPSFVLCKSNIKRS